MSVWGGNLPFSVEDHERILRRAQLEREVENLVGPIISIGRMTDAALYGMRDAARRAQPTLEARIVQLEQQVQMLRSHLIV